MGRVWLARKGPVVGRNDPCRLLFFFIKNVDRDSALCNHLYVVELLPLTVECVSGSLIYTVVSSHCM